MLLTKVNSHKNEMNGKDENQKFEEEFSHFHSWVRVFTCVYVIITCYTFSLCINPLFSPPTIGLKTLTKVRNDVTTSVCEIVTSSRC